MERFFFINVIHWSRLTVTFFTDKQTKTKQGEINLFSTLKPNKKTKNSG